MNKSVASASKLYLDSNVFIYLIEGVEPLAGLAAKVFEIAGRSAALVVTSELSAAECMIRPFRERNSKLIHSYERLFEGENDVIRLPIEYEIIKSAAEIGGALRLKLADAIHLASALTAGCEVFVTNDKSISAPKGIEIVQLVQIESNL